jgi:hypothetical protein
MKKAKTTNPAVIFLPLLFLFSSCLGINTDIILNENGSGIIVLEYHVSAALDSLGKLDGNELWNTVPVGRADFERTLYRLSGMKLLSISTKENGKNLVTAVKMEFENIQALLAFLDAGGRRSSFSGDGKSGSIVLILNEGADTEGKKSGLDDLVREISESYSIKASMTFPAEGTLTIRDRQGRPSGAISGTDIHSAGKKVSFSFSLYEVLSATEGITVEFRW